MKNILNKLTAQEYLTRKETKEVLLGITHEIYNEEQIAALLMAFQMRGIAVDELLGFRDGLLESGRPVDLSPYKVLDIVGTGGDGKNTFNISTCSCFVVAGAGYKVAKHGNYAATSVSGASNVLEEHGVKFSNDNAQLLRTLEECGFVYMHAPLFACGMKFVGPARKALKIPTCFNLLGPLVNPSRPHYQLLGVANLAQMRLYAQVYERLNMGYGIVSSLDGYDEISLTGDFKVKMNRSEHVYRLEELGFSPVSSKELYGGQSKEEAKHIFDAVLENRSHTAQRNVVLVNSAFAIHVVCPDKSIEECLHEATVSLESGRAANVLKRYVEMNH